MEANSLTQTLAIWGAITGTIGTVAGILNLAIRMKQHKKDQPSLVCSSNFSFEHSSGEAKQNHKIIARSLGKRPVTIDYIRYYIKPKKFWDNIFRRKIWKQERWVYDQQPKEAVQITEGKKNEFKISIPPWLSINDIIEVKVHDQSNTAWRVDWPSPKKLAISTHYKHLHKSEESNEKRLCKVSGYTASGNYHIYTHWNPTPKNKNSTKGRFFNFKNENDYREKLQNILKIQQPKILACEIDEIT